LTFVIHSSIPLPRKTEQHPRHDPPRPTTVRDRTPEALNALTSVAPSAPSRRQQRRAVSSVAPLGPSRRQIPRAVSTVPPSAPSRTQLRRALSHFACHLRRALPLRESNRPTLKR
ncbi:hypothetical protein HN51_039993, partial [Arachis hypogaea]